jgi:hypothetical protein
MEKYMLLDACVQYNEAYENHSENVYVLSYMFINIVYNLFVCTIYCCSLLNLIVMECVLMYSHERPHLGTQWSKRSMAI